MIKGNILGYLMTSLVLRTLNYCFQEFPYTFNGKKECHSVCCNFTAYKSALR